MYMVYDYYSNFPANSGVYNILGFASQEYNTAFLRSVYYPYALPSTNVSSVSIPVPNTISFQYLDNADNITTNTTNNASNVVMPDNILNIPYLSFSQPIVPITVSNGIAFERALQYLHLSDIISIKATAISQNVPSGFSGSNFLYFDKSDPAVTTTLHTNAYYSTTYASWFKNGANALTNGYQSTLGNLVLLPGCTMVLPATYNPVGSYITNSLASVPIATAYCNVTFSDPTTASSSITFGLINTTPNGFVQQNMAINSSINIGSPAYVSSFYLQNVSSNSISIEDIELFYTTI